MKGTDVVAGSNFDGCWRVRERERGRKKGRETARNHCDWRTQFMKAA